MVGFGLALSSSAHADELASARAQQLAEVSHAVTVSIDRGVARYVVQRTFTNPGARADEARVRIDLAHGAAGTGLRIRARDRWYAGDLMEAEAARAMYLELTGVGEWEPKDPALLEWEWADALDLRIFPVLPGGVSTVEYTLTAPLEYRDGRYVLTYPRLSDERDRDDLVLAEPVLTVQPGYGNALTEIRVADRRVAPGAAVVLGPLPPPIWIGEGEPEEGSGYVHSSVQVSRNDEVAKAAVHVEIDHTYASDIQLELVAPEGIAYFLGRGEGSTNDVRRDFEIELRPTRAQGAWTLRVGDHAGLDVGTLDAWTLELVPSASAAKPIRARATGLPAFIPDAKDAVGEGGLAVVEIEPPPIRTVDARLGRVVASAMHGFSRFEIDAAPRMSELPVRASVVFVVDVSRSVPEHIVDMQLEIASAYLAHVPDASAEVVVFDRRARRLFGAFVPAADFADAVAKARKSGGLRQGNGSALEGGLETAAAALDGRRGPTRIVSMTDAILRTRFRNAIAIRALTDAPKGSVVHVVIPEDDMESSLRRDDAQALSPIASRHGGVLYRASAPEHDKRENHVDAMLPLVRPVSLDAFDVRGLPGQPDIPNALLEGEGWRAMLPSAGPPERVVVTGKLWARPFRRVVKNNRHFDEATAAFVFSEDEHHDLSREEMLTVAFMGRAVSPVTSYLAIEPGVRPSTEGFEEGALGLGNIGLIGKGGGGGAARHEPPPRMAELLGPAARRCVEKLAVASGWEVDLSVETTRIEIVDVEVTHASDAKLADCIVEGTWATLLPHASWPARKTHHVALR